MKSAWRGESSVVLCLKRIESRVAQQKEVDEKRSPAGVRREGETISSWCEEKDDLKLVRGGPEGVDLKLV